jgi:hypothetical protein
MPYKNISLHAWVRVKMMFVYAKLHKHFRIPARLGNSHRASTSAGGKGRYLLPNCFRFRSVSIIQVLTSCNSSFVAFTVTRKFVFEVLMIYALFTSHVSKYFIKKQAENKPKLRKWQRSLRMTEVYEYGLAERNRKTLCFICSEN